MIGDNIDEIIDVDKPNCDGNVVLRRSVINETTGVIGDGVVQAMDQPMTQETGTVIE